VAEDSKSPLVKSRDTYGSGQHCRIFKIFIAKVNKCLQSSIEGRESYSKSLEIVFILKIRTRVYSVNLE